MSKWAAFAIIDRHVPIPIGCVPSERVNGMRRPNPVAKLKALRPVLIVIPHDKIEAERLKPATAWLTINPSDVGNLAKHRLLPAQSARERSSATSHGEGQQPAWRCLGEPVGNL